MIKEILRRVTLLPQTFSFMLRAVHPKLPMRNKQATLNYYRDQLHFEIAGSGDYDDYLMLKKDDIEIHFFRFSGLKPRKNYGQIYNRAENVEDFYKDLLSRGVEIHPNGGLETKPWGQREFSLLDPDFNLLTFGSQA